MIKRILALCLVFILTFSLIGTMPTFAAATISDVNLMYDLGIVERAVKTGLFDTGYTRSDFARSLTMLDKAGPLIPDSVEGESEYASDISGSEFYREISSVIRLGYMKTDDQKRFRPSQSLTLNDAIYALVNALGYNVLVNNNADEAMSYRIIAQKIGLLKGVNVADQEKVTDEEVAAIIANAMGIRFFSAGNVNINDKCFFDCWDLTVNTGKVYANSNMGISGEKASYKRVNIDGKLYYTEILIPDEMIGSEVTFYVDNSESKNEIVSIYSTFSEDSTTIDADDIANIREEGANVVIYLKNNEKVKILKNGFAIINGKTFTPSKAVLDLFKSGKATFLDSDGDGDYDIVNISLMVQKVIGGLIAEDKVMSDLVTGATMNFGNATNLEVYLNKKAVDFSDLKEGYVVGICCDNFTISNGAITYNYNNAKTIKIYASSKQVSGRVDGLEDDKIIVDDMDYNVSAGYLELVAQNKLDALKLNDQVNAYLDMFGNIAYYVLADGNGRFNYGYLIMYDASNIDAFTKESKFKIMDTKGDIKIYVSDEKFVLDGEKVLSGQAQYSVNGSPIDLTNRQVVRYYAKDDVLKELDTKVVRAGVESMQNTLSEDHALFDPHAPYDANSPASTNIITRGIVDKKGAITKDTIYFVDSAPLDATLPSDDDFWVSQVATPNSFTEDDYYITCYDINDDMKINCFVRYSQYGKTGAEEEINSYSYSALNGMMVEKVTVAINEKGDEGYNLYLAGNNEYKVLFAPKGGVKIYEPKADTSINDAFGTTYIKLKKINSNIINQVIKPGDVIRVDANKYGEINYIEKIFNFTAHNGSYIVVPDNDKKGKGNNYCFANLEKISGDYIIYSDDTRDNDFISMKMSKQTVIPVYYVNKDKVEMVPFADLPTITRGKEKVKIYLRFYKDDCREHMIYVYD